MSEIQQKTKNTNTFRFKSFADRVSEIDIRRLALYRIGHENEELTEDNETYFHQTLKKWMVLNLTDEFGYFSRRCLKIVTLPQLVHEKDFVVDLLLERLATATNLSLQPLLELLYVLARDLREDFYAYFQRVLDRLICLLNTQDAEQLEWTLVCLAYLFKALKPYLKRNIGVVFHAILPLLDEQRYDVHVTNFAVECFSFIARDLRDYRKFLDFVLETVAREQVDSVQGCGRLLFEIVRGVKGLFHSVAGDFLQFVFECLVEKHQQNAGKAQLLCEIVQHAVRELLNFIHPQNMSLFWTKLCAVAQTTTQSVQLLNLIGIFLLAVEHRNGRYLTDLDVVVPTVLKMLDCCMQPHAQQYDALQLLALLVGKILLASSTQLTQLDASRLVRKTLSIQQREIYEQFALQLCDYAQFEMLVLPAVIAYFEEHLDHQACALLAQIVVRKQPLAINATGLQQWRKYDIHFKQLETLQQLEAQLKDMRGNASEERLEQQLLWLIIAPHISGLQPAVLAESLKAATVSYINALEMRENVSQSLSVLALLIETQIHLKLPLDKELLAHAVRILQAYVSTELRALGCLDQLLAQNASDFIDDEKICEQLASLLSSHSHTVRLTAAHCLQSLHAHLQHETPYHIFYKAECIEPDIHTYREQLLQLQQLEPAGELFRAIKKESYKLDVLRFLLGMLYHNFKFVWEPVLQLIVEYARLLSTQQFWSVYQRQLEETTRAIDYTKSEENTETVPQHACWRNDALNELLPAIVLLPLGQQQLLHYRNLLWLHLPRFGQVAQQKNRELVPLFLQFVDEEYRAQLERRELSWDLSAPHKGADAVVAIDDVDSDLEEEPPSTEPAPFRQRKRKQAAGKRGGANAKAILQTLQSKLGVFAAQPNPRALYREPELYALYMELLAGPNAQLQKVALDCVFAYKPKAVMPYREQLYALIDEQKFKDELLNFKLEVVSAECREELMQLLLRLLYGKMITKGSQRNVSSQLRKGLILRFLGQCKTAEIMWFLEMAFGKYTQYTCVEKLELIPALVHKDFDVHAAWSPKKLQSVVNLLELIRKEFGGLMEADFHNYMLKLLTFVGAVCNEVLQAANDSGINMHPKMPTVYRNVKNAALLSLVNFFAHIDQYDWQPAQIATITQIYVWPAIEKLSQESIHTPTALLKLLLQWGERPQHFSYLNQKRPSPSTDERVIFHHVITLLLNEKAKPAVRRPILALIERLLVASAAATAQGEMEAPAAAGLLVVKPFILQILNRLKMNFSTRAARQSIDKRDLNILSLLTTHVEDAETCDSLLQLLLPILIAKSQSSASEDVVTQVITTLSNLIKRLDAPEIYLLKIAPLFEQTQEVVARKQLCQLVADIAKKRHRQASKTPSADVLAVAERLKDTARIMLMLNAWDKRWVEQPDYDKRLDALKEITQKLEAHTMDLDLGVLIIYNCCYFLRYDKDIGLRDNASEHLRLLLPRLTQQCAVDRRQLDYLVNDVFLNLARRLIRDSNDNVRYEGIRLLGEMARQCPDAHEILADLAPLGDRQDVEVDFFENLTHLQSHRHGRALLKFCTHAQTLTKAPNARTLTQFVLPLASRYLLQEKYSGKHTLIDAAIETVGVVCQLLPWQHYHTILRYYLMKMRSSHDHQKQCVRIVVRILDAFHFDLSQAQADVQALQHLKTELSRVDDVVPVKIESAANSSNLNKVENGDENDEEAEEAPEIQSTDIKNEYSLDAELSDADDDELDAEEEKPSRETEKKRPVLEQPLLLPVNASKRVLTTITTVLIPTLNRSITEKSSYDNKHKLNRKRFSAEREEEEIQRVPIALALIKLMQKLPKELLDTSVPGVFMKVCTFLRSPLKSVRMLTRDILRKIMLALGSGYLAMLMDHLQTLLTRGFQVHVLAVTVHGVLDAMRTHLQPDDVESCLHNLLEVALNDIFGDITAEKEIEKIAAHTPEAKPSAKSFLVLHIAARNIRESCLLDLLMPFKEHLARSHSRKIVLKIQECFAKIVGGLVENVHISRESLLIFIYGTVSESITDLLPGAQKRVLSEQEKEKMRRARPDCFIIQPPPRMRSGAVHKQVKSNAQANAHILIEFGLEMLHIVLKRKKLVELDYQPFLNPLLPLLRDALKSTHVRVVTFALKCFAAIWNDAYELPTLEQQYLHDVVERMFGILKNVSTFGAIRQEENLQLVKSVYKAIVALLRKCTTYTLTNDQIEQLVFYVEQNLYEGDNQLLSFSLLKAIVARKVDTPDIHEIMKRIGDLSIISESDFVRDEARAILVTYIMEYTLKKRVDQIVKFFTAQLRYSLPAGRQSVIKFLHTIVKKFPRNILAKRAEFLYLSLGTRLVNDDDPDCRRAVAECMELLITRLEKVDRQRLFDITLLFFAPQNKPSVVEMAAAMCSRFLNAEKQAFASRLKMVLPTVVARLTLSNPSAAGRFVRAPAMLGLDVNAETQIKRKKFKHYSKRGRKNSNGSNTILSDEETTAETPEQIQRAIDHEIIQMQFCLLKMFEYCAEELLSGSNDELNHTVDELAYESQKLLAHEHAWVRCNAAKIIAHIVASYDFSLVGAKLSKGEMNEAPLDANIAADVKLDFIYLNPAHDIKSLVLDLCAQVIPGETPQNMIDEIMKILLYIANMLRDVPFALKQEKSEENVEQETVAEIERAAPKINLYWLVRNIRYLINKEVAKAPHSTSIRSALFTLIEGMTTLLSVETLEQLAPALLSALVREMNEDDQHVDSDLRQQALRVGSRLRKRIGTDVYDKLRTHAITALMRRRAERKKLLAQEKVHDPARAAKRKMGTQERKKLAKKRKMDVMRGKAADVKQKLKRRKRKAEEDLV